MQKIAKVFYVDGLLKNLKELKCKIIAGKTPKNVLFWSLHTLSLVIYFLTVYIDTIKISGFTHSSFHRALTISKLIVVILCFGILRSLFNRFILWNDLRIKEFVKGTILITCIGLLYHFMLVVTKTFVDVILYSEQSIPNVFVDQYQYIIINSFINVLFWGTAFFALKVIVDYNQNKLEYIDLEIKLKEEKINLLQQNINPDFLTKCLKMSKDMILEDVQEARSQLSTLSNILRYTLVSENGLSKPWQEELGIIDSYIRLKIKIEGTDIDYSIKAFDKIPQVRVSHSGVFVIIKEIVFSNISYLSLISKVHENIPLLLIKIKTDTSSSTVNPHLFFKNIEKIKAEYNSCVKLSFEEGYHIVNINLQHVLIAES